MFECESTGRQGKHIWGVSSVEGGDGGGEVDGGVEVALDRVVAGGAGAELLALAEEVLDEVPRRVGVPVVAALLFLVALRRDHRRLARFPGHARLGDI